jgi:hypothetical protein
MATTAEGSSQDRRSAFRPAAEFDYTSEAPGSEKGLGTNRVQRPLGHLATGC